MIEGPEDEAESMDAHDEACFKDLTTLPVPVPTMEVAE